jgi:hypothetical protein
MCVKLCVGAGVLESVAKSGEVQAAEQQLLCPAPSRDQAGECIWWLLLVMVTKTISCNYCSVGFPVLMLYLCRQRTVRALADELVFLDVFFWVLFLVGGLPGKYSRKVPASKVSF